MRAAPRHKAGLVTLVVAKDDEKLLQDFLAKRYNLSRRSAKAVIDGRSVWVNQACIWMARYQLKTGDTVVVPTAVIKGILQQNKVKTAPADESLAPKTAQQQQRHIRVLWQNADYLVADKPSGVISCEEAGSAEDILRKQESLPILSAVHRLDRDTTGCLLFAKTPEAREQAVDCFKKHAGSKIYHAISVGRLAYAHQTIDEPLDGKRAVSVVTREMATDDTSFLRIRIETGRTNQIRRHLASVRAPILGDRVFGLKNARDPRMMRVPRQMLHASGLEMPNPTSPKEVIRVHSPLPADFRSVLKLFGMGRKPAGHSRGGHKK